MLAGHWARSSRLPTRAVSIWPGDAGFGDEPLAEWRISVLVPTALAGGFPGGQLRAAEGSAEGGAKGSEGFLRESDLLMLSVATFVSAMAEVFPLHPSPLRCIFGFRLE